MRSGVLPGLIGSLALASCAGQSAPRPGAGMAWSLAQVDGEGAKLAYGRPQSDDVLVMLTCAPKSDLVRVSTVAGRATAKPSLGLRSGDRAQRYAADTAPSGFGDGVLLESSVRPDDPVLARFAASGELALDAEDQRTALPAADPAQARHFIESCRR
ncbi:MAG: hypothetical protein JWP50_130 [Phenylobacterium sp.]|nr:hypothetical protein [Phenylobacterium sp.]